MEVSFFNKTIETAFPADNVANKTSARFSPEVVELRWLDLDRGIAFRDYLSHGGLGAKTKT